MRDYPNPLPHLFMFPTVNHTGHIRNRNPRFGNVSRNDNFTNAGRWRLKHQALVFVRDGRMS